MEAIIDFVRSSWVEWLFAGALSVLAWLYRNIASRLREEQAKNEAIADGVQSLLRDSIISNYNKYVDRGWCPLFAKDNVTRAYEAYHNLGGNGTVTQLYQKLLAMPDREVKEDDEQ